MPEGLVALAEVHQEVEELPAVVSLQEVAAASVAVLQEVEAALEEVHQEVEEDLVGVAEVEGSKRLFKDSTIHDFANWTGKRRSWYTQRNGGLMRAQLDGTSTGALIDGTKYNQN